MSTTPAPRILVRGDLRTIADIPAVKAALTATVAVSPYADEQGRLYAVTDEAVHSQRPVFAVRATGEWTCELVWAAGVVYRISAPGWMPDVMVYCDTLTLVDGFVAVDARDLIEPPGGATPVEWVTLTAVIAGIDAKVTSEVAEQVSPAVRTELPGALTEQLADPASAATAAVAAAASAAITRDRPVNLAAILPADSTTDATAALNTALSGSATVYEWPAGKTKTIAGTVTIPAGKSIVAPGGGRLKYTGAAQAVKVFGRISGLDVEANGTGLGSIAVWLMPGSDGARAESLRIFGLPGAALAIGGSTDGPMAGTAINPVVTGVTVGDASQYAFRVDQSTGALLDQCVGLGAALDVVKARYSAERLTVSGGSFSGARAGDGIDTFQGGRWVRIIGVDLHDNSQSGVVVKTDGDPAATLAANMALGMPEQPQVIGCRIWNNGGVGLGMYRSDGTDSEAGPGVIPMLFGGLIDSCQIWDNAAEGIYLMGRGLTVANVQAWGNLTSTSSPSGQVNVDANARGVRLVGVTTYGASTVNGNQSGFRFAGQQIYASQCNAYGVRRADLIQAVDDAALYAVPIASRSQRFGFYVLAGADVHLHQSSARFSRLAGVSAAAGATVTYDECRIEDAAGALITGTNGRVFSAAQQVGWRHELTAGTPVYTKGLTLTDTGGSTYVTVGDNGATGTHYVTLAAKTQVQVPGVDLAVSGAGKVLAAGGLGTGGATAATSMGAQVYKVPIYNASGALLGYVPVHSS